MKWEDRNTVKRGNIGERIVSELITKHGYIHYGALTEGAHLIDFFCLRGTDKDLFCIEVKTKKRLAHLPMTGFETRHFKEYLSLSDKHGLDIIIIFIDDFEECIYSARLSEIKNKGKKIGRNGRQIVFPLSKMKLIRKLTNAELSELKNSYTADYNYSETEKYFS